MILTLLDLSPALPWIWNYAITDRLCQCHIDNLALRQIQDLHRSHHPQSDQVDVYILKHNISNRSEVHIISMITSFVLMITLFMYYRCWFVELLGNPDRGQHGVNHSKSGTNKHILLSSLFFHRNIQRCTKCSGYQNGKSTLLSYIYLPT